jgi:hypothetical protein
MTNSPLPIHWGFALGTACDALSTLVRAFDFQREVGRAAYVGIRPTFLVEVIDGFLAESADVVLPGNRTDLMELRRLLTERIVPAFEQGEEAARKHRKQSGCRYGTFELNDIHDAARRAAPPEVLVRGWFVEGFCVAWASGEVDSLRDQTASKDKEPGT